MKITILFFILIGIYSTSAQQREYYDFEINSKYDTPINLMLAIDYTKDSEIPNKTSILDNIKPLIIVTLKEFSNIEIYREKRDSVEKTIERLILQELNNNNKYHIKNVQLADVEISRELNHLMLKILKIEQSYYEIELKINDRLKQLNQKLINVDESNEEIEKIKLEIIVLENYKYIRKISDKHLLNIIKKNN